MAETGENANLAALRTEMLDRFRSMERLLDRMTNAIEKVSDFRDLTIRLESAFNSHDHLDNTRFEALEQTLIEIKTQIGGIAKVEQTSELRMTKLELLGAAVMSIGGGVIAIVAEHLWPH